MEKIGKKVFEIEGLKVDQDDSTFFLSGYANTKNKADAYGDIPTNFKDKPVYNLKRYKSNPVLLVDHINSASHIAGKMIMLEEDDHGLKFQAELRKPEDVHNPMVKDAISAYMTGFGKGLSIGGKWHFQDRENPKHLTRADLHEVSLVGVGADQNALTKNIEEDKACEQKSLEMLIGEYRNGDISAMCEINKLVKGDN
jgi:HK97 family phage prohead protease